MKWIFKNYQYRLLLLLLLATVLTSLPAPANASTLDQVNSGFSQTGEEAGYPVQGGKPKQEFADAWVNYVNGMISLMGLLFMVLMIYGGWLWMSAKGNEEQVQRAKKLIINAVIGLTLVIGARLIIELALIYLGQAFNPS